MPKTGSSSIQDTLYYNLNDPEFHYIQLTDHANAAHFIQAIFKESPESHWIFRRKGWSADKLMKLKQRFATELRDQLVHMAKAGKTSIISAETIWQFKRSELESLKTFFDDTGIQVKIIVYMRPIKSWIESAFQENVKYCIGFSDLACLGDGSILHQLDYKERLCNFEIVFGQANLILRCFARHSLHQACVVTDFCKNVGIDLETIQILRSNEAISADAVRLLHAYNKFARDRDPPSLAMNHLLLMHLEELRSVPFHMHSKMTAPIQDIILTQNQAIVQEYGIDLNEDLCRYDALSCIQSAANLQEFSRECLDWLAWKADCAPITTTEGDVSARAVADQVAALVRRPTMRLRWRWFRHMMRVKIHGISHRLSIAS